MHFISWTEKNYVYRVRWFIRWHGLNRSKEIGDKEVEAFLSMLANECKAAPFRYACHLADLYIALLRCPPEKTKIQA
jgi:hypothetical protein